jgi:hypothetical protein
MRTFILLWATLSAMAQQSQSHRVTLFWRDTANPTGTTYNIYRSTGSCPTDPPTLDNLGPFAQINTAPITGKSYADTGVVGGTTYCYFSTAVVGAQQSAPSGMIGTTVPIAYAPIFLRAPRVI